MTTTKIENPNVGDCICVYLEHGWIQITFAPEGWYEWNQNEETHWAVTETPRAWMPLPPTSAEGVEHG